MGVAAEDVWDLAIRGEDLDLGGFAVTATGSSFPEVVVWDLLGFIVKNRLNFLVGRGGSLLVVELRGGGEGLTVVWPCKSDAMEGRGDELGAVEGCDVDLDNCGGGDRGIDIPGL